MAPRVKLPSLFSIFIIIYLINNNLWPARLNKIDGEDKSALITFASSAIDKTFPRYNIVNSTSGHPATRSSDKHLKQHDQLIIVLELLRQLFRMEKLAKQRQLQKNSSNLQSNHKAKKKILIVELKNEKNPNIASTNTTAKDSRIENELTVSRILTLILVASALNRHLEVPNEKRLNNTKSFGRNRRESSHDRLKESGQHPIPIYNHHNGPPSHIVSRGPQSLFLRNSDINYNHHNRDSNLLKNRHDPTNDRYDGDSNSGSTLSSEDFQQRINQNPYLDPYRRQHIHPLLLQQPSPYLSSPYHRRPPPPILIANQHLNIPNDNQEPILINKSPQEEEQQLTPLSPIHHMILAARKQQLAAMEYERRRIEHGMEQRRLKEQEREQLARNGHQNPDENVRFDDDSSRGNNNQQQEQQDRNQDQDQPENNTNNQEVNQADDPNNNNEQNENQNRDEEQGQNQNQQDQNQDKGGTLDKSNFSAPDPAIKIDHRSKSTVTSGGDPNVVINSPDNNVAQPNSKGDDSSRDTGQPEDKQKQYNNEVSNKNNDGNKSSNNDSNIDINNGNDGGENSDVAGGSNSNNSDDGADQDSNNNDETNGHNQQNTGLDGNANDGNPDNNQTNQDDDPDIQSFQNLAGDSDFTDLFPPGLLSESDIKDIRKQQEEQKKRQEEEEERRRQQQGNEDQNNQQQGQGNNYNDQSQGTTEDTSQDNYKDSNSNSNDSKSDASDTKLELPLLHRNYTNSSLKLEPKVSFRMDKINATDNATVSAIDQTNSTQNTNSIKTQSSLDHVNPMPVNQLVYPLYSSSSEVYQNGHPVSKDFSTFNTNRRFDSIPDIYSTNMFHPQLNTLTTGNNNDNEIDRSDSSFDEDDMTPSENRQHRSQRRHAEPPYSYLTSLFNIKQLHKQFSKNSE